MVAWVIKLMSFIIKRNLQEVTRIYELMQESAMPYPVTVR